MADILWGGRYIVDDVIANAVDQAADRARVPRNVLRAFVIAESYWGGRVNAFAHNTSGEDSIGLLQLNRSGGQGAGRSVAELRDPATNLAIGVPPIGRAWNSFAAMGLTRDRVFLTAVHSGHPTENIDVLQVGSRSHGIALTGGNRIADTWGQLEGVQATQPSGQIEGYRRIFDEAQQVINQRPAQVAIGVIGALVLLAAAAA